MEQLAASLPVPSLAPSAIPASTLPSSIFQPPPSTHAGKSAFTNLKTVRARGRSGAPSLVLQSSGSTASAADTTLASGIPALNAV